MMIFAHDYASPDLADAAAMAAGQCGTVLFDGPGFDISAWPGGALALNARWIAGGAKFTRGATALTMPQPVGDLPMFDRFGSGPIAFTDQRGVNRGIWFDPVGNGFDDNRIAIQKWLGSWTAGNAQWDFPPGKFNIADNTQKIMLGAVRGDAFYLNGCYFDVPVVIGAPEVALYGRVCSYAHVKWIMQDPTGAATFTPGGQLAINGDTADGGIVLGWDPASRTLHLAFNSHICDYVGNPQGATPCVVTDVASGSTWRIASYCYMNGSNFECSFGPRIRVDNFRGAWGQTPICIGCSASATDGTVAPAGPVPVAAANVYSSDLTLTAMRAGNTGIILDSSGADKAFINANIMNLMAAYSARQSLKTTATQMNEYHVDLEHNHYDVPNSTAANVIIDATCSDENYRCGLIGNGSAGYSIYNSSTRDIRRSIAVRLNAPEKPGGVPLTQY